MSFEALLDELRAVAEPSRLRLLAILTAGEFSVTELTEVLGQSQPRVSRHLKLLAEAGLLQKFREQHWIYYRVPAEGPGRDLVTSLLARVDPADPTLLADRRRVDTVLEQRREGGPGSAEAIEPKCEELSAALAGELGQGRGSLLYFGAAPGVVLASIATRARRVVGVHGGRAELQRARALLHARGLSHCVLQQGDLHHLAYGAGDFDAVVLDRALATHANPVDTVREAARVLDSQGELIVAEDYDALAVRVPGSHPLATLKAWLAEAGLLCMRLHPLDLDGRHVLLAVAQPGSAVAAAA